MRRAFFLIALLAVSSSAHAAEPLRFWHTQGDDSGALLARIVADYNATNPPIPVEATYQGSYDDIFRKTQANLLGGSAPDLVVAYESMIADYMALHEVVDLEPLMNDPRIGLSAREQADLFPSFIESSRFAEDSGALLAFPFTKSVLVLYANDDLVRQAGFDAPPETWEAFEQQCLAMNALGKRGFAMAIDASTLDGMFMSRGVGLYDAGAHTTNFDAPGVIETLAMLQRLSEQDGLYQIDGMRDEDVREFIDGQCAFFIKSSTRRPTLQRNIEQAFAWSMNPLPHGQGAAPMTILYGANISLFASTEERHRAAWEFIKYFTSPEVTARWAIGSGYLPVRRSASELPVMQAWLAEHPANRQVFSMIPLGRPEPSPRGWQAVRDKITGAAVNALIGRGGLSPQQRAETLKAEADAILNPAPPKRGIALKILAAVIFAAIATLGLSRLRRRRA